MSQDRITYRTGTHRIRPPEETLEAAMPHMRRMGITRIADVTGLDTVGIPVVMVCRPNARSVSVSQGKGATIAAAKASGLMESIEGYHAEHNELPVRIASFNDLAESGNVVGDASLPPLEDSRYSPEALLAWVEGDCLLQRDRCWLPYEMVHTDYTIPRPQGSGSFPASSNGLASGNSVDEATVHGICEVIERDAISLWHQRDDAGIDAGSLNLESIDNALCRETLSKLDAAGQDVFVWDITSDIGIPTYFSVLLDRDSHTSHIGVGSGTHLSREVALLRALHEAVQVRTTYIVGARDDISLDEYTTEGIEAKRDFFSRWVGVSGFGRRFDSRPDLDRDTVEEDMTVLLDALKNVDIERVLRVNLTRAEFGIPVVRVVIPGLEAPHDDEGYLPGVRAMKLRDGVV